jgi:hypothetical protein
MVCFQASRGPRRDGRGSEAGEVRVEVQGFLTWVAWVAQVASERLDPSQILSPQLPLARLLQRYRIPVRRQITRKMSAR